MTDRQLFDIVYLYLQPDGYRDPVSGLRLWVPTDGWVSFGHSSQAIPASSVADTWPEITSEVVEELTRARQELVTTVAQSPGLKYSTFADSLVR